MVPSFPVVAVSLKKKAPDSTVEKAQPPSSPPPSAAAYTLDPFEYTTTGWPDAEMVTATRYGCDGPDPRGIVSSTSVFHAPATIVFTVSSWPRAVVSMKVTQGVPDGVTATAGVPSGPARWRLGLIACRSVTVNEVPVLSADHRPLSAAQATWNPPDGSMARAVPFTFWEVIDLTWRTVAGPNGTLTLGMEACMATAPRVQTPSFVLAMRTAGSVGAPMGRVGAISPSFSSGRNPK